jgi:signal transduction histidine kinase
MAQDFQREVDILARIAAVPAILDVVCSVTGMGFAAVAHVTEGRWIACSVRDDIGFGLKPGGELQIETTICHEIRQHQQPVIINNVADDATYATHRTPAQYGFQSYISMPIIMQDGRFFGTLCAIDPEPHDLTQPAVISIFKLFTELIAFHLNAQERIAVSDAALLGELETARLREQFIAVLGHDLRNPLAAIDAGVTMLLRPRAERQVAQIIQQVQSSVRRMSRLIDDVLDFARGRLGGGFSLELEGNQALADAVTQVLAECRMSDPTRPIVADIVLDAPLRCDPQRIGQLLSNLLGNALKHGAPEEPVRVAAHTAGGMLSLSVANTGAPIPAEAVERLFRPFVRGDIRPNQQGLGLGLYIAAEIARAHGGTLDVASSAEQTMFTFRMPLAAML